MAEHCYTNLENKLLLQDEKSIIQIKKEKSKGVITNSGKTRKKRKMTKKTRNLENINNIIKLHSKTSIFTNNNRKNISKGNSLSYHFLKNTQLSNTINTNSKNTNYLINNTNYNININSKYSKPSITSQSLKFKKKAIAMLKNNNCETGHNITTNPKKMYINFNQKNNKQNNIITLPENTAEKNITKIVFQNKNENICRRPYITINNSESNLNKQSFNQNNFLSKNITNIVTQNDNNIVNNTNDEGYFTTTNYSTNYHEKTQNRLIKNSLLRNLAKRKVTNKMINKFPTYSIENFIASKSKSIKNKIETEKNKNINNNILKSNDSKTVKIIYMDNKKQVYSKSNKNNNKSIRKYLNSKHYSPTNRLYLQVNNQNGNKTTTHKNSLLTSINYGTNNNVSNANLITSYLSAEQNNSKGKNKKNNDDLACSSNNNYGNNITYYKNDLNDNLSCDANVISNKNLSIEFKTHYPLKKENSNILKRKSENYFKFNTFTNNGKKVSKKKLIYRPKYSPDTLICNNLRKIKNNVFKKSIIDKNNSRNNTKSIDDHTNDEGYKQLTTICLDQEKLISKLVDNVQNLNSEIHKKNIHINVLNNQLNTYKNNLLIEKMKKQNL